MKAWAILFCWLLLSTSVLGTPSPRARNERRQKFHPFWVSRGDWRSPKSIKALGGFLPNSIPHPTEVGYGLYNHQKNKVVDTEGHKDTVYVSTSALFDAAAKFACTIDNGGWLPGTKNRYVYLIHATSNMIDMSESLLQYDDFPEEFEYAAMGDILWEQVFGWVRLADDYRAVATEDINHDRTAFWVASMNGFCFNEDYNRNFNGNPASGGQLRLAGVPKSEWPWSHYQDQPMQQAALEFMDEKGSMVGWQGAFPLMHSIPGVSINETKDDWKTWVDEVPTWETAED